MRKRQQYLELYELGLSISEIAQGFSVTKQAVQYSLKKVSYKPRPQKRNPEDRFWSHVKKGKSCWLWTGAKTPLGYGKFFNGTKHDYAHRFSLSLVQELKPGLEVDHLCRVRHCVNPDHLEQVVHKENIYRSPKHVVHGDFLGRRKLKTHCIRGHEYTPENTRVYNGKRRCKTCHNQSVIRSNRRRRALQKAQALVN